MSFTETFDQLTVTDKSKAAADERQRRITNDIEKYIAIPVAVPVMGRLSKEPVDYKLGWAVGVPGKQEDNAGKPARAALTMGFPDEETADDFCYLLNNARSARKLAVVPT